MKTNKKKKGTTITPKGVRLHWQSLKEIKPVELSNNLVTGKIISEKELKNRNHNSNSANVLVL